MELDFDTIKALSSPTRIRILREVLDQPLTPTQTSKRLGKSKSTVSSHLSKLWEAGLVERDKEEGRKRVVYTPTSKAKAIIRGSRRKVEFSIVSSALTSAAGIVMAMSQVFPEDTYQKTADTGVMAAPESARQVASGSAAVNPWITGFGAVLGLSGLLMLVYVAHLKNVLLDPSE